MQPIQHHTVLGLFAGPVLQNNITVLGSDVFDANLQKQCVQTLTEAREYAFEPTRFIIAKGHPCLEDMARRLGAHDETLLRSEDLDHRLPAYANATSLTWNEERNLAHYASKGWSVLRQFGEPGWKAIRERLMPAKHSLAILPLPLLYAVQLEILQRRALARKVEDHAYLPGQGCLVWLAASSDGDLMAEDVESVY